MQRLLLLVTTTTYRASAFLEAARRLGVDVVVGSERPQVLAAANPGGNLTFDFKKPERAVREIVDFAAARPIHAVVAADDDGAILAAVAARTLGLTGHPPQAVSAARDKHRTREVLAGAGLLSPRFELLPIDRDPAEAASGIVYPCVVKPLALSASRGVMRANGPGEFICAFRRLAAILRRPELASPAGDSPSAILVESFIPGVEVALEGLVSGGELHVLALYDKPDPLEGPFFEETIYVTPSRLPRAAREEVASCTARAVRALGLVEGPIHAELRVNDQGPWVLEIAPRSIGGLCSRTLRFQMRAGRPESTSGIAGAEEVAPDLAPVSGPAWASLEELILRHALGLEFEHLEREPLAAGVMMIPIPRAGVLWEVGGQDEARGVPGIEDLKLTIPAGQPVVPLPEGSRYLGFIFARGPAPDEVEAALREAHRRLEVVITG